VKRQPGEISCRSTRSSWLSARLNDPDSWGSSVSTVVMLKSPRNSPTTRLRRRARDGATFAEWLLPTPGCIGWLSISRPLISAGSRPSGEREPASRIPSTPGSRPGRRDRRSQGRYLPSKRQRTALVLRYYLDLSVAETAQLMGCADGTVKSLTHKAIASLRQHPTLGQLRETTDAT